MIPLTSTAASVVVGYEWSAPANCAETVKTAAKVQDGAAPAVRASVQHVEMLRRRRSNYRPDSPEQNSAGENLRCLSLRKRDTA